MPEHTASRRLQHATHSRRNRHTDRPGDIVRTGLVVVALILTQAACAPDAVSNREAKGFNAYLDSLPRRCPDLRVGRHDIADWLRTDGSAGGSDYVYWLDQTSRLYYNRITDEQYRDSVMGSLGGGRGDARAVDCMIASLPENRPMSPKAR